METATFVPKLPAKPDQAGRLLTKASQVTLLFTLALMPVFFVPNIGNITSFPKVYLVLFGSLLALFFTALVVLRSGSVGVRPSPLLGAWWLLVLGALVSAFLAPNLMTALFGDVLEIHTVGFLALMGLVMSLMQWVVTTKRATVLLYGSFAVSAVLVSLIFWLRVLFGTDVLSFQVFQLITDTFIGSFNDLGIFLGCVVMMTLVALAQLDLPKRGVLLAGGLLVVVLSVMATINFFIVWLVISLFSLLLLMYMLTKDRFGGAEAAPRVHQSAVSMTAVGLVGFVFLFSALFVIAGTTLGTVVSNATGVNYIEIRPSLSATGDILRQVYGDQLLTGAGPNHFADTWSRYKDVSINNTIFWNTTFNAASGYMPTWFITTGILGVLGWLLFLAAFVYTGYRALLTTRVPDTFWFFMASISFVGGTTVWIMSFWYVPGPMVLLFGAICTGTLIVARQILAPSAQKSLQLLGSSKTGFVLIALVMITIISIFLVTYGASKQFSAAYVFLTTPLNVVADTPEAVARISRQLEQAYTLYPTDTYARSVASYQLQYLNSLLTVTSPTASQQQEFQNAISNTLNASSLAITQKPTDARNWQVLADAYASLSTLNIEGAKDRAFESYAQAEALDPKNPFYVLQKAIMTVRAGDTTEGRRLALLALDLKPNYTDALYLLSQMDIMAGDIATAIRTTESIISIEANNPGRYYQLGVLYGATQNTDAAITAFTNAITLNPNYANARYFLAEQYLLKGDKEAALAQLNIIRDLSPENTAVNAIIEQVNAGGVTTGGFASSTANLPDAAPVTTENDVTTADEAPETPLLTPVNTPTTKKPAEGATTPDAETPSQQP